MQGTRLPDAVMGEPGPGWDAWEWLNPESGYREIRCRMGSYMKVFSGGEKWCWYLRGPDGDICTVAHRRDSNHGVTEHEDGTITVSPSIIFPNEGWHGFLQRGVWT